MRDHKCFIKTLKFDDEKRVEHVRARFMFFDFETYVGPDGQLCPNLAVAQYDTGEEFVFPSNGVIGPDITDELCQFIFQEKHENFYIIAHNFQSFDGMFILRWLLNNGIKNEPLLCGGKIKNIHVPSLRMYFRDSLAYAQRAWPNFRPSLA